MKIEATNVCEKKVFVPKHIMITFDSQDDLDKFAALFNNCRILTALGIASNSRPQPYEIMESLGANILKYWKNDVDAMISEME